MAPEKQEETRDLSRERELVCIPIARGILELIADDIDKLPMGDVSQEDLYQSYKTFFQEMIAPLLSEKNPRIVDLPYIFQLVMQPITQITNLTQASIESTEDYAVAKLFGKDDIRDLTVKDIVTVKDKFAGPEAAQ